MNRSRWVGRGRPHTGDWARGTLRDLVLLLLVIGGLSVTGLTTGELSFLAVVLPLLALLVVVAIDVLRKSSGQ